MSNVIQFTIKGVDKFSGTMKKVTGTMKDTAKTVKDVGTKATVTAGALVGFVTVMASGEDRAAKFSTRLGKSVEELTSMQFVATQAGLSTEAFNMATQRATRRVAEAAQGFGEASGALNELGIDAKSFQNLKLSDQMATLADKMQDVKNPADQLRLAFKLFDSEGTAVLQMLKQGGPAMLAVAKDAQYLGLVLTKQAAANAEHFMDSMGRATGSIKGTSRAIADALMPVLSGLANRFANTMADNREAVVSFVKDATVGFFTFTAVIGQVIDYLKKSFTTREGFSQFLDNMGSMITAALKMLLSFGKMIPVIIWEGFKAAVKITVDFLSWMGGAIIDFAKGNEVQDFSDTMAASITDAFSSAASSISEGIKGPLDEFKSNSIDASATVAQAFGVDMEAARAQAEQTIGKLSEFGTVVEESVRGSTERAKTFLEELSLLNSKFMAAQGTTAHQYATEFYNVMQSTTDAVSQGVAESIVEGKNAAEIFGNIGKQVAKDLIAMWIKVGIQRVIAGNTNIATTLKEGAISIATGMKEVAVNVFKAIASIPVIGPFLAVGATILAVKQVGDLIRGAGSTGQSLAGARAIGGGVQAGKSYMVGENGTEVFTPSTNGYVTPNKALSGGGITIGTMVVHIMENMTDARGLQGMDKNDIKEKYAVPLIAAFDELNKQGTSFEFVRSKL